MKPVTTPLEAIDWANPVDQPSLVLESNSELAWRQWDAACEAQLKKAEADAKIPADAPKIK